MKEFINIPTRDRSGCVVFVRHIATIQHDGKGAVLLVNAGAQTIHVVTDFSVQEVIEMIKLEG